MATTVKKFLRIFVSKYSRVKSRALEYCTAVLKYQIYIYIFFFLKITLLASGKPFFFIYQKFHKCFTSFSVNFKHFNFQLIRFLSSVFCVQCASIEKTIKKSFEITWPRTFECSWNQNSKQNRVFVFCLYRPKTFFGTILPSSEH